MRYENRAPDEGINASREHPLREFAWLVGGSIALLAAAVFVVALAADWIAPRIPYRYEARLADGISVVQPPESEAGRAAQAALQALADRLAARMDMPEGMQVRVGYRESGVVNAFATLGGQTVFFHGLIAKLASEDAIAMVMAHELAHLKLRHPAQALGRGIATGILLSVVSAELGRSAAGGALGQAGMMTLLAFNREQERAADLLALEVLAAEYGHVGGALDLFAVFLKQPGASGDAVLPAVEFLRTHPLTASRVAEVSAWAKARGVPLEGSRRPKPSALVL